MQILKAFLFQTLIEVKRKILIPILLIYIITQIVIFSFSKTIENKSEGALIFTKWTQSLNTILVFAGFSIFFAFSWDAIKEKKLAQLELSKPVSKNGYFVAKFICFSLFVFMTSLLFCILSQLLGLVVYGKTFLDIRNLKYALKISDYEAKNIRVEGIRTFGSRLKENVLIADLLNTGELELIYNIYPEYTGLDNYYLYFKAQIYSEKNATYMRFKIFSNFDEDNFTQFDEKIISMQSHYIKLPKQYFLKPAKVSIKIERLDKNVYVRFDQFEPQIIYASENVFKTIFKELWFQSLICWQSSTPAYLLAAFTSPPTAIIGSLIYWIWANSKDMLKLGRKHAQSKLLYEEEEHRHRSDTVEFPLWVEKISVLINTAVDKVIPDFKIYSFTPLLEKKITINDLDFINITFNTVIITFLIVLVTSLLFKLYEFPV